MAATAAASDSRVSFLPSLSPRDIPVFLSPFYFLCHLYSSLGGWLFLSFFFSRLVSRSILYHVQSRQPRCCVSVPSASKYTSRFLFSTSCASCRPGETWVPHGATTCQRLRHTRVYHLSLQHLHVEASYIVFDSSEKRNLRRIKFYLFHRFSSFRMFVTTFPWVLVIFFFFFFR